MDAKRTKVVVVEDNPGDARLIRAYLQEIQTTAFEISEAGNLAEGIDRLRAAKWDIVLLDLGLPDSQGIETLHTLRKLFPAHPPIVVLTGLDDDEVGVAAVQAGAQDYLHKSHLDSRVLARTLFYAIERDRVGRIVRLQGAALQAAATAMIIADSSGVIEWANPAFSRLTGYAAAEVIGLSTRVLKSGVHDAAFYRQLWETILAGQVWQGELVNRCKDGHLYTEEMTITPVAADDGRVTHFIASKQDVTQRKADELALRESERFMRSILNGLAAHIAIVDETGVILAVNLAWRSFAVANASHDASLSEGQNYLQICDRATGDWSAGAAEFAVGIRDVLSRRRDVFEQEYPCHAPDEQRWFLARVTRFPGDGPARAVIAHENITARVMAEQALRTLNDRTLALNEVISIATSTLEPAALLQKAVQKLVDFWGIQQAVALLVDLQTMMATVCAEIGTARRTPAGAVYPLSGDPLYVRLLRDPQVLVIDDVPSAAAFQPYRQALDAWNAATLMIVPLFVGRKLGGALLFADDQAHAFGSEQVALATAAAQTIAQALENSLLHSEIAMHNAHLSRLVDERTRELIALNRRTTTIVNSVNDAILLLATDETIVMVNKAFERQFDYAEKEVVGLSVGILVEDHNVAVLLRAIASLGTGPANQHLELPARRRDGTLFDADIALAYASSDSRQTVCSLRDISHLKAAERLKDQFISTVNHELRNPIATISLVADSAARHYDRMSDDQRRQRLQVIHEQTKILTELVDSVLDIARLEESRQHRAPTPTNIQTALQTVITELASSVQAKQQTLQIHSDQGDYILLGDQVDFRIVWRNLLGNANKYTSEGGAIEVGLGTAVKSAAGVVRVEPPLPPEVAAILPPDLPPGVYVVGQVRDTGPGMPDEDLAHIFTRFHRGWAQHSNIPGSGLGLALVREVLAVYDGGITVRSELQVGSTFSFWIPLPGMPENRDAA